MDKIRVLVSGICGRMGNLVAEGVRAAPDALLVAGVDPAGAGSDLSEVIGGRRSGLIIDGELGSAIVRSQPNVMVDFTAPAVVMDNLREALPRHVACVVGTTGFTQENLDEVAALCERYDTPALIAPNFSVGAVLMMRFAAEAATRYEYAQVLEMHHPGKKDAPSGTAMLTARRIAEAKGEPMRLPQPEHVSLPGVMGGELSGIGVHAMRMEGFVADQRVVFGGTGETLTIEHRTVGRECFIPGVLLAVRKVVQQKGLVVGLENLLWP
ncbi:MAG: 4-hydroxy-tetrahydrodipicolinate reductase [Armatimonadetes bacterium]|nr:4-hydroxy-tetrahydrodipicolinate reductase [Armatimonadota bacterium]